MTDIPTELPTTVIGLLAFVILVLAGVIAWILKNQAKTVQTFMTYIEKKNGNLEKATQLFTATLEERDKRMDDMLIKRDDSHKEMMDDMAARLEATLPLNSKKV